MKRSLTPGQCQRRQNGRLKTPYKIPVRHVRDHGEFGGKKVDRNEIQTKHFKNWIAWARELGIGLDFNPTCFSHPKSADGFTLSHPDKGIRQFWIEHCQASREVGAAMGRALGSPTVTNVWIPDAMKDTPADRRGPREPAKHRSRKEDAMTLNIDFAPTMLALAGVPPPAGMQGRSLLPLLNVKVLRDWRKEFFYEHDFSPNILPPSEGVRAERWTYIRWINEQPLIEELFNVRADPLEGHNLAAAFEQAGTLAKLRARWEKYTQELK